MDNRFNKLLAQCPQLPVLTPHIEPLHKTKRHDSTAGKHCVLDMHHTKSLDAFDEVVHHVHGAWRPHYGAIQLVWCPQLPELTPPHIEPLHKTKRHDSTAGKHCVLDMHHTKSLDAFDEVVHHVHGARNINSSLIY